MRTKSNSIRRCLTRRPADILNKVRYIIGATLRGTKCSQVDLLIYLKLADIRGAPRFACESHAIALSTRRGSVSCEDEEEFYCEQRGPRKVLREQERTTGFTSGNLFDEVSQDDLLIYMFSLINSCGHLSF